MELPLCISEIIAHCCNKTDNKSVYYIKQL